METSSSTILSMQSAFHYSNHRKMLSQGICTTFNVCCNVMQKYVLEYITIIVIEVLSAA